MLMRKESSRSRREEEEEEDKNYLSLINSLLESNLEDRVNDLALRFEENLDMSPLIRQV